MGILRAFLCVNCGVLVCMCVNSWRIGNRKCMCFCCRLFLYVEIKGDPWQLHLTSLIINRWTASRLSPQNGVVDRMPSCWEVRGHLQGQLKVAQRGHLKVTSKGRLKVKVMEQAEVKFWGQVRGQVSRSFVKSRVKVMSRSYWHVTSFHHKLHCVSEIPKHFKFFSYFTFRLHFGAAN